VKTDRASIAQNLYRLFDEYGLSEVGVFVRENPGEVYRDGSRSQAAADLGVDPIVPVAIGLAALLYGLNSDEPMPDLEFMVGVKLKFGYTTSVQHAAARRISEVLGQSYLTHDGSRLSRESFVERVVNTIGLRKSATELVEVAREEAIRKSVQEMRLDNAFNATYGLPVLDEKEIADQAARTWQPSELLKSALSPERRYPFRGVNCLLVFLGPPHESSDCPVWDDLLREAGGFAVYSAGDIPSLVGHVLSMDDGFRFYLTLEPEVPTVSWSGAFDEFVLFYLYDKRRIWGSGQSVDLSKGEVYNIDLKRYDRGSLERVTRDFVARNPTARICLECNGDFVSVDDWDPISLASSAPPQHGVRYSLGSDDDLNRHDCVLFYFFLGYVLGQSWRFDWYAAWNKFPHRKNIFEPQVDCGVDPSGFDWARVIRERIRM